MLFCLAPHSAHGDLFLRQTDGQLSRKLLQVGGRRLFFSRKKVLEQWGSALALEPPSFRTPCLPLRCHDVNKGLRMYRPLVSLGDNSILGKHPVSTRAGANFQIPHMTDPVMDQFPHFLLPASSFSLLTCQGIPKGTPHHSARMTVAHW